MRVKAILQSALVWAVQGRNLVLPILPWPIIGVQHQSNPGKLSVLQATVLACMPSSELQSSDQTWLRVVLALVTNLSNVGLPPDCGLASATAYAQVGSHQPDMMEEFRVEDTAAPEVKFLDRCKINCSEGVLQELVRRSRMRVWGTKMIRHRRSPLQ